MLSTYDAPVIHDVARRIIDALPDATSVVIRDRCDRDEVVAAVADAFARRVPPAHVTIQRRSDRHIAELLAEDRPASAWPSLESLDGADTLVVLGGWPLDRSALAAQRFGSWRAAASAAADAFEASGGVTLVVAVAHAGVAAATGRPVDALDAEVWPAVALPVAEVSAAIAEVRLRLEQSARVTIGTPGCILTLDRGDRPLHVDDGVIDGSDRATHAVVSNLPCGSVYWTVVEGATRGSVRLDDASVLTFDDHGRVSDGIYRGERVSHVGIGVNPAISTSIGWTLVDEHRAGAVFIALGENRYLGGLNASTINVDLIAAPATVHVGDEIIVSAGHLP